MTYIPKIGTARLENDAVTTAKILDGTIAAADLATGAVTSTIILDGTITDADVAAANKDGAVGTPSLRTIGTGALQAMAGSTRLDTIAAPTGSVSLNSQRITNLADPSSAQDGATKAYVDALSLGLYDYKQSARVVSTTNITLSGTQTIDGVAVIAGDRVLVSGQTTGANNGIYIVAAGAWARSSDADTSAEVGSGTFLAVDEGTANADSLWLLTTNDPITLGTTSLTFSKIGQISDLIAGSGLTKTGNTLDVGAGTGILSNANDVAIDTSVVPRKGVANTFTAANVFQAVTTTAGQRHATQTQAANYTADPDVDNTILVNPVGTGGVTITIPASHTIGATLVVKDRSGGASATDFIRLDPADADTIDGNSTYDIVSPYEAIELRSDGTNWFIV